MNWLWTALSWLASFWRSIDTSPPDALTRIILRDNISAGPFGGTGGQIYQNTPDECAQVANLIQNHAPNEGIEIALGAAWLAEESKFSIRARNPNNQDAKPGETAEQAFDHCDLSIAQFDGATVRAWPDMAGKTIDEITAKLFDPEYAIVTWSQYAGDLLAWAKRACSDEPAIAANLPPGAGPEALGVLAYNAGRSGALSIASKPFDSQDAHVDLVTKAVAWTPHSLRWTYATQILAKAAQYRQELAS